ncbi:MAG: serine/threonine-protein kinase, partial [Cyanobacteria bacterium P01_G01_bin.49]
MTFTDSYPSRYKILGKIGQGQFGQVYFAIHRKTGEFVALKNLGKGFPTNLFLREFSYLISLRHPNIVACQTIEHHKKGRYLVMDYCEGGTLRNLMDASGQLSLEMRLSLITDILAGLEEAHQHNIIHCDIKPENVLLSLTTQGWTAKITDFGIAKISQESTNFQSGSGYTGSPAYMAPERFYGKYSERCDLYSVGILLYELIVGERPFSGLPGDLMLAHLNQRIKIPDSISDSLKKIIGKALEKLPKRRFSSAKEMLETINVVKEEIKPLSTGFFNFSASISTAVTSNFCIAEPFETLITHLAANDEQIYVGMGKKLTYFNYSLSPFLVQIQRQVQIFLPQKITKIELKSSNCFILTQNLQQQISRYSLYCFAPNPLSTSTLVSRSLFSINVAQLITAIDFQGKWLATISLTDKEQPNAYFQVFKLPNLSPFHSAIFCPMPSQLIALDNRYLLAIFTDNFHKKKKSFLYFFNCKGYFIK